MFINLVRSEQDCFNAQRSPRMIGDVLNWSLLMARCFASGDQSAGKGTVHVFGGETENVTDKNRYYT